MSRVFYIVGPTAVGKSDLAAEVAVKLDGEIVNADAFQIYQGFDVLSGKPDKSILANVPHHLIGAVPAREQMNAARFRELALPMIEDIRRRGKLPIVVGGTGLYVKALTEGLSELPPTDAELRIELEKFSTEQLQSRLTELDPEAGEAIDLNNRRRVIRAIEIVMISGWPLAKQRTQWKTESEETMTGGFPAAETNLARRTGDSRSLDRGVEDAGWRRTVGSSAGSRCHEEGSPEQTASFSGNGVFVFRDREDLYQRINQRVEAMLRDGAIDDVRDAGQISRTAEQMIGVRDIRKHLAGETSLAECTSRIQQATRRYAKRQLTWFRNQSNFEPLNLSLLKHNEAVERICAAVVAARGSE